MFNEGNKVFVERLSEAIDASVERDVSGKDHFFVPMLDVLMGRRGVAGSKFDHMPDDEFELIFFDQCKDAYTSGQNMAAVLLKDFL